MTWILGALIGAIIALYVVKERIMDHGLSYRDGVIILALPKGTGVKEIVVKTGLDDRGKKFIPKGGRHEHHESRVLH